MVARRLAAPALMIAAQILAAAPLLVATPAAAQFMNWPFWGPQRPAAPSRPDWPWQGEQPQRQRPPPPVDASKAPPPSRKAEPAAKTVVVMGDSMADWLAYGLEDALAETPELGVVRKHRTYSGLMRAESKKGFDWPQGAREILTAEKADLVVMMIGINDRQSIRERAPRANPKQPQPPPGAQPAQPQPQAGQPTQIAPQAGQQSQPAEQEEGQAGAEPPRAAAAPEPAAPGPPGPLMTYEFRTEKWGEAYGRRIDETIAALKSKGVPVFWVGLPAIRGPKSTADMAYLNELYRSHAEKAGAIYVDIWDGFVDENGVFTTHGPDFEGQTRRLRAGDGVHFTKAGARKLAHYVEREIRHVMLSRGAPMALPAPEEPTQPARPGTPAARPVAGPVVPLTAPPSAPEGLLGAGASRPPVVDPNADGILVKGEPLPSISGRADDFAWPRPDAPQPEPEPAAAPSSPKPAAASAPPATKPAAPAPPAAAPAKKHTPATAAAAEPSRRPMPLSEDAPRGDRRRAPQDNAPRPPAAVPLAPIH